MLGGDATYEWIHFLVRKGAIDGGHIALLNKSYEDYGKGTLDIVAFLHFDFGALASHPRMEMESWREEYLAKPVALSCPRRRADCLAEARGHVTAIVTAANSFLTAPIARMTVSSVCWRAIPKWRTANTLARSPAFRAFTKARSRSSTRGLRAGAKPCRTRRKLLLRRLAKRRAADGEGNASGGHPGFDETLGRGSAGAQLAGDCAALVLKILASISSF